MHRVVHFEIHAEEPQRAISFYSKLFGWQFTSWGTPQEYWVIATGKDTEPGINGGLIRRRGRIDGEAVIAYVCTIDVPSVDDALTRAVASGGSVAVPKMAIPGVGWLAYAKDTEGNVFGLMRADPAAA